MIELRDVSVTFNPGQRNEYHALRNADLTIASGEVVGILGPSGSGKSTLLSVASLLRRPSEGAVLIKGRDTAAMQGRERTRCRSENFGLITQRGDLHPYWTAIENVLFTARARGHHVTHSEAAELLTRLGLPDRVQQALPDVLSGGERQRVAAARAMVTRPDVLFADEPTSALDTRTGAEVIDALRSTLPEGTTLVVVSHDEALVSDLGARVVEVQDGIVTHGSG